MRRHLSSTLAVAGCAFASCAFIDGPNAMAAERASLQSTETTTPARKADTMKIRLLTADGILTATLDDNAAARDFASLLPLSLTLRDHARTEKVSDLPRKLTTRGAPAGADPDVADLAYYAPWGNLAIFYRDFGYSSGLVKLGRIDAGIEKLRRARDGFVVRFERAEAP
jgi:hypothetical protein